MQKERQILLIYTGGTVGMVVDPETDSLVPFDFKNVSEHVPEIKKFDFLVDSISFNPLIDSSDMSPLIWSKLAGVIEDNYLKYDGFVILHGTDTMAYSASALSFMLQNLGKPVVFTGSQLPLGMLRTDGKENIITALEIAAAQNNIHQPLVPEVSIFFQDKLFRGNRTKKDSSEQFSAFRSANYPPLAEAGIYLKYNYSVINNSTNQGPFTVMKKMDSNVAILKLFPGISREVVCSIFNIAGLKAVVLETYGSGNAPTAKWFLDEVKEAIARGIIILNVSQCMGGSVEMGRYETGVYLLNHGVVSGYDITTESAVTKLMFLLANCKSTEEIKSSLNKSLQGEINL